MHCSRFRCLLVTAMLTGCEGSTSVPLTGDAGPEVADAGDAALPVCTETFTLETGDPDGHAMPLGASATEARAGRIAASDLPTDRTGNALWAAGDFVLANDRVAVLIEDVGDSDLYAPWGGGLIGVATVEAGRLVDAADFMEVTPALGRFAVHTTSVTVLHDGSDGMPAVVRAIGRLDAIPFIAEFARALAPADYGDLDVAIDFTLAPGAEHVDLALTFAVTRPVAVRVTLPFDMFIQKYRMPDFSRGPGFGPVDDTLSYLAFTDEKATSYAWSSPDGPLSRFLEISGVLVYTGPAFTLAACARTTRPWARVVIGGPGADGLVQAIARSDGETLREITGTVVDSAGMPAAAAHVNAQSAADGAYLTRALTDETGHFSLHVPPGAVRLTGYRRGEPLTSAVEVAAGATTAMLTFGAAGAIHVVATEGGSGVALPVRVQVLPVGGPPAVPESFGEQPIIDDRLYIEFPVTGDTTLRVPAGDHQVVVSRGYEYEILSQTITVHDRETVELPVTLDRVVDTAGAQCADFHLHTWRSPDSPDTGLVKVASAVAEGVELPVRSDHDWVGGFEREITALGVERWAYPISSLELTTFVWGHFGVFPLNADPSRPNAGAFSWAGRLPPAVFADVRARPERPTIIINHPSSFAGGGAYFTAAGWDPVTGTASQPTYWDEAFTLVEVFNDSDWRENRDASVASWLGLLTHGRHVLAVGSSDSHKVMLATGAAGRGPVGYPRTCIALGDDDPRTLTPERVRDAVLGGDMVVSGGIYMDVTGPSGVHPGGEAHGVGARATLSVRVQAARWVDVKRLIVMVDGVVTETITLDASTADPGNPVARFQNDVQVDVPATPTGSFVILLAEGDDELAPVHPARRPFAMANPIWLYR